MSKRAFEPTSPPSREPSLPINFDEDFERVAKRLRQEKEKHAAPTTPPQSQTDPHLTTDDPFSRYTHITPPPSQASQPTALLTPETPENNKQQQPIPHDVIHTPMGPVSPPGETRNGMRGTVKRLNGLLSDLEEDQVARLADGESDLGIQAQPEGEQLVAAPHFGLLPSANLNPTSEHRFSSEDNFINPAKLNGAPKTSVEGTISGTVVPSACASFLALDPNNHRATNQPNHQPWLHLPLPSKLRTYQTHATIFLYSLLFDAYHREGQTLKMWLERHGWDRLGRAEGESGYGSGGRGITEKVVGDVRRWWEDRSEARNTGVHMDESIPASAVEMHPMNSHPVSIAYAELDLVGEGEAPPTVAPHVADFSEAGLPQKWYKTAKQVEDDEMLLGYLTGELEKDDLERAGVRIGDAAEFNVHMERTTGDGQGVVEEMEIDELAMSESGERDAYEAGDEEIEVGGSNTQAVAEIHRQPLFDQVSHASSSPLRPVHGSHDRSVSRKPSIARLRREDPEDDEILCLGQNLAPVRQDGNVVGRLWSQDEVEMMMVGVFRLGVKDLSRPYLDEVLKFMGDQLRIGVRKSTWTVQVVKPKFEQVRTLHIQRLVTSDYLKSHLETIDTIAQATLEASGLAPNTIATPTQLINIMRMTAKSMLDSSKKSFTPAGPRLLSQESDIKLSLFERVAAHGDGGCRRLEDDEIQAWTETAMEVNGKLWRNQQPYTAKTMKRFWFDDEAQGHNKMSIRDEFIRFRLPL